MKVTKLKVTVFLKQEIPLEYMYEFLSNYINGSMKKNDILRELHTNKERFKYYTFSGLYPAAKNKAYESNTIYTFYLSACDPKILKEFENALNQHSDDFFSCCLIDNCNQNFALINNLKTITPCILTYNNKALKEKKMLLIRERVISNLVNKYNKFFNTDLPIDYDFIEQLEITNRIPIRIRYKNTSLLGFKLNLIIKEDPISQKLAGFALQTGLLEKNSLGLGHCFANVR